MCFMFGAGKEHVHRLLGLVEEAEQDEPGEEDRDYALHSSNACVEPPP
jgi:hypothetical protein